MLFDIILTKRHLFFVFGHHKILDGAGRQLIEGFFVAFDIKDAEICIMS